MVINEPNVTSVVGPRGMTRSDRVFTPRNVDTSAKSKGKEIASHVEIPTPNTYSQETHLSPKVVVTQEEAEEFSENSKEKQLQGSRPTESNSIKDIHVVFTTQF